MPLCSTGMPEDLLQDYGIGCAAHDVNRSICTTPLPAECVGRFPSLAECEVSTEWCASQWCYVDGDACNLTHRSTDDPGFRGAGPLPLNLDRDYSCEYLNIGVGVSEGGVGGRESVYRERERE